MLKKQGSLLNFFKKSTGVDSSASTQNESLPKKPVKANPAEVPSSQEDGNSTTTPPKSVSDFAQSCIEEEEDLMISKKLHKKLKKCVKIADDDEDEGKTQATPTITPNKFTTQKSIDIEQDTSAKPKSPIYSSYKANKENIPTIQRSVSQSTTPNKENPTTPTKSTAKKAQKKTPNVTPSREGPQDVIIDIGKHEGNVFDYGDFNDSTPGWAKKENAKDAQGRKEGDPSYDPTTLYIPPGELEKLTPTMKQYWTIKSQNNDKVVLFKLGKFYELFYEDALICHKELDLNWMGNKMHVGFPEKAIERYGTLLVQKGFKVCVVEQTETPKQMEERIRHQTSGKKEKTIRRAMVQVMSKGTFVDPNDTSAEPKVLLALRCRKNVFSVAFLEVGANVVSIGSFQG